MVVVLSTAQAAGVVGIPATVTGHVYAKQGNYWKSNGELRYCYWNWPKSPGAHHKGADWIWHSYLKFNLDALPDTCLIISADLNYYQFYSSEPYVPFASLKLIPDPVPLDAEELYSLLAGARQLASPKETPDGWVSWPFNDTALAVLDSCGMAGAISLAVCVANGHPWVDGYAYGCYKDSIPFIRIEYTVSGTNVPQGIVARQPDLTLALAPNPTADRFITAQYHVAATTPRKLAVRDVLGRIVKSFTLDPSGHTRLDLRGLPPGVYMATLEAGTQSLTRKLVITGR